MEEAINEAIKEGNAGNRRHFYNPFKSLKQNARLKAIQHAAFEERNLAVKASKEKIDKADEWYKISLAIVPLFAYTAVYCFHRHSTDLGFMFIWFMLCSASFLIWRQYWKHAE